MGVAEKRAALSWKASCSMFEEKHQSSQMELLARASLSVRCDLRGKLRHYVTMSKALPVAERVAVDDVEDLV